MKLFTLVMLLGFAFPLMGQDSLQTETPKYPGEPLSFYRYLNKNLRYTEDARLEQVQGIVYTSFVLSKTGNVDSVWIDKGIHPDMDKMVLRVLRNMDQWEPAKRNGEALRTLVHLPVGFALSSDVKQEPDLRMYPQAKVPVDYEIAIDPFELVEYVVPIRALYDAFLDAAYKEKYEQGTKAIADRDYVTALDLFNDLYPRDPKNVNVIFNRGLAKYRLGKVKGACKDWKRAEKLGDQESGQIWLLYCTE